MQESRELNTAQIEAVNHINGPCLVIAGAGSGKTRVVTERIKHLLSLGVPASEILAVTFTNKAAEEMQKRVREKTSQNVLTTTFHSLSARILRESIHHLGYSSSFAIYDEKDSEKLLKSCLESLGIKDDKGALKTISNQISQAKNDLIAPSEVVYPVGDARGKIFRDLYTLYQTRLKEYNALDFDDLLFLAVKLFEVPEVASMYQKRWNFLLVDEYQDTNQAQYLLCRHLTEKHGNIFVVGDPDQSIYSWRGANIGNILNFEKDFPGARVIALEQNYRSTNTILKAANSLIDNNRRSYKKELFSSLGDGEKVHIHPFDTDREEAQFVTNSVRAYLKSYKPEEIVIFYRTNAQSRIFEDYLLRAKIPYVIIGGLSFYQRQEIKDILSFLRLIISPADFISFTRTINLPKRGFGPAFVTKLASLTEQYALPVLEVGRHIIRGTIDCKLSTNQQDNLEKYLAIFDAGQKMVKEGCELTAIIKKVIEITSYELVLKEDEETYEDRKENVLALVAKANEWETEVSEPTLSKFIEELSLKSTADEVKDKHVAIRLMTIHNGKGLEFAATFIVGMEENLFPHINAKDSNESVEEERRLFYVGMTRAKRHLHLSYARYRFLWGSQSPMTKSRFLDEISEDYIEKSYGEESEDDSSSETPIQGSIVMHKDFGRGVVLKVYETSFGLTYDVQFYLDGTKRTLVAKYAKLSLA